MTTISSPTSQVGQENYHGWANRVNEAGKGIVSIDVRDGFALANSTNFYDRLLSDVMQITFGSLNYLAGKFQLSQVMALPFVMDSAEQESVVFWRLYKSGLLNSEFDQIVPLYFYAFPQVALHLTKVPASAAGRFERLAHHHRRTNPERHDRQARRHTDLDRSQRHLSGAAALDRRWS